VSLALNSRSADLATSLELIASDVRKALDAGLYYAALATVLTIPHVCASLEKDDPRAAGTDYKKWCKRYVCDDLGVSADVVYSLRCGVLHQGQTSVKPSASDKDPFTVTRLMFVLPGTGGHYHRNQHNNLLQYDLMTFCNTIIAGLARWWEVEGKSPNVKKNLPNLVQYRPDGMSAFIKGGKPIPVIM
jgi:hypothetical protein